MTMEGMNGTAFDVVIVGAGPAGLFAALEICRGDAGISMCLIDKGRALGARTRAEAAGARSDGWLQGFGGAGFFIGGRLSLDLGTPTGRPFNVPVPRAVALRDAILDRLDGFHAVSTLLEEPPAALKDAATRASDAGLTWQLNYPARHLDPAHRLGALAAAESELADSGARMLTQATVGDIKRLDHGWSVTVRRGQEEQQLFSSALLLAPGRGGAGWLAAVMHDLGGAARLAASVGVRIETSTSVLEPLTGLTPDPRLFLRRPSGLFRTYAFAAGGSVVVDSDGDAPRITIKPAGSRRTENTSFSLLWQPEGHCHELGLSRYRKPAVSRFGGTDSTASPETTSHLTGSTERFKVQSSKFKVQSSRFKVQRSTFEAGRVEGSPTADIASGDVRSHWPDEYWDGLDDFLDRLEHLAPGVRAARPFVYSPAIERQWTYDIDESGRTELAGLYLAGDGAGVSQGAMGAAISGMAAGRALAKRDRRQETGDRGQGTGDRGQGTGDRGQGTGDRGQGTGDRGQGTGDRRQGTGDRGQGTGDRGQGTGSSTRLVT
jgi:uncharacterized protein